VTLTKTEGLILRLIVALGLLTLVWFWYEGMSGPRRTLTKREKRMVAELGPKIASDARFKQVAFAGNHSDHRNVMQVTGTVASVEMKAALREFIMSNYTHYQVLLPGISVTVQQVEPESRR
jgi:hypothetical protein